MRSKFIAIMLMAGVAALAQTPTAQGAERPPNIVFMLADDLGLMDTHAYGSRFFDTPNIDKLVKRGMKFTKAYAASPLCSPTRASILTGKYPGRLLITTPSCHLPPLPDVAQIAETASPKDKVVTPRGKRFLPLEETTMGETFKAAGYSTAFMGKWHLGQAPYYPDNQGFDVVVGGREHPGPPGGYFAPWPIDTIPPHPEGTHIDDAITSQALKFIEANKDQPFLLNLWFYSVHAPFEGKWNLIRKYQAKKDPRGFQDSPIMGAMIETMDVNVGKVMAKLDELGLADNTIVVFFSDNGGNIHSNVFGTTATNNSPLRAGKGNIHEGGVREPMIVIWPGVTRPGSQSAALVSSIDFYPTLLEMTGVKDLPGHEPDGISIVAALKGGTIDREAIFCHFPHYIPATGNLPSSSVRQGDWKLIRNYGEGPGLSPGFELYNLADDLSEKNNLAATMPGKVKELDALITRNMEETGSIVPFPNPKYDPGKAVATPAKRQTANQNE